MDAELLEAKNALRASMREQLVALPPSERAVRSRQIVEQLVELPAWIASSRVLLFAPLPTEPDLDLFWFGPELVGKEVAYPRVEVTTMRLYLTDGLGELELTRWGLREPPPRAAREVTLDDLDLVLVPGLAFDAANSRLGRGGGFYDRLLATRDPDRTRLVGVCFAFQVLAQALPLAAHDVRLDALCTDVPRGLTLTG